MKWHMMYIQTLSQIVCAKVVYTQESKVPFLLHANAAWPSRPSHSNNRIPLWVFGTTLDLNDILCVQTW